jgi:hypothetical protein
LGSALMLRTPYVAESFWSAPAVGRRGPVSLTVAHARTGYARIVVTINPAPAQQRAYKSISLSGSHGAGVSHRTARGAFWGALSRARQTPTKWCAGDRAAVRSLCIVASSQRPRFPAPLSPGGVALRRPGTPPIGVALETVHYRHAHSRSPPIGRSRRPGVDRQASLVQDSDGTVAGDADVQRRGRAPGDCGDRPRHVPGCRTGAVGGDGRDVRELIQDLAHHCGWTVISRTPTHRNARPWHTPGGVA